MSTDVPLVPNDFLLAVHRALLLRCGVEETRRFWEQNPLVLHGRQLAPGAIARHLTDSKARTPLSYALQIMNVLEWFLLERGASVESFADSLLSRANRGSFVSSRAILTAFSPFLARLFRHTDPHRLFLRMFRFGGDLFFPELIFREVSFHVLSGQQREAVVLFGFRQLWEGKLSGWDGDVFTCRLLRMMPKSLGLCPLTEVRTLSDCRRVEEVLVPSEVTLRAGVLLVDGKAVGRVEAFEDFCSRHELAVPDVGQPSRAPVVVMEQGFTCPRRRREVLQAGCAYGAPVYLFKLRWRYEPDSIHAVFQHFIHEAVDEQLEADEERARTLLREFASANDCVLHFVYDEHQGRMYCEQSLVCKGVPATILRNCLRVHVTTGRTEFSFREFKTDPAIASHPKNTGFEVRLKRLKTVLDTASCGIHIEPAGRGRFRLAALARLSLEERSGGS